MLHDFTVYISLIARFHRISFNSIAVLYKLSSTIFHLIKHRPDQSNFASFSVNRLIGSSQGMDVLSR